MTSDRDIEKLSAYLDNQLSTSDRARLDNRLRQEPALKRELETLRQTRLMIRSLPKRRAPRNFTITPEMVGARRAAAPRPVFGMLSAIAVVLLIFVFITDFLLIPDYVGMFQVSQSGPVEEVALEQPVMELKESAGEEAETLIFPTPQPTPADVPTPLEEQPSAKVGPIGVGGGLELTPTSEPDLESPVMADSLPATTEQEMPPFESARAVSEETSVPEEGLALAQEAQTAPSVSDTQTAVETLPEQMAPTESAGIAAASDEASSQPAAVPPQPQRAGLWFQWVLWLVELLLISVAAGAGLIAIYFRIRRNY